MSSEQLADGVNPLDAELAATWDVLKGYSGRDTDLGIARRFGGAAAAYSLRDIGAMNGSVVRVRRSPNDTTDAIDDEERFSANQVQDGTLEKWVNGELEGTLPADVDTAAAAYSLRKVKASYSGDAVRIRRSSDDIEVNVAFDSDNKVSASSAITNIAEQGGESGQTTATTLGDFISGTDAFVHTWYDQAGSNNAVQETAGNQPKIAENGALLADGIQFDGNNDALNFTDLTLTDASIFTVLDIDGTENLQIILGGSTTTATATMIPMMQTSSTNTQVYKNATVGGAEQGSSQFRNASQITLANRGDAYSELATKDKMLFTMMDVDVAADKVLDGISQAPSDATTWGLKGTMEELIIYNSDQSSNRFKIESNINNYYGLYNDANDFSGNPTAEVTPSAITLTNESKTGFTAEIDATSGTKQINFPLLNSLVSGDDYFVSFDYTSTSTSTVGVKPRTAALGSASNDVISATNSGFYGGTGDTGHNGFDINNTATVLSFQTTAQSFTFTVSNLKVSRIARNGFVETWYDQSGNGEDMTQGTAGNQPSIVRNGGQVKDYNGNNSIDFVSGSTRVLDKSGTTTAKTCIVVLDEDSSGSAERAILGFSASTSFMRLDTSTDLEIKAGGVTVNYRAVPTDVTSLYFWYTNGTDEDKLFANNVEEGDTTSNTPPNLPFTRIGARNSDANPYNSRITEVIAFAEDLSADRTVLQDDVNNNYNIF